jgi:L-histidine N-alpha-methyltransferase
MDRDATPLAAGAGGDRRRAIDLVVPFAEGEEMRTEVSAFRRARVAAELAAAGFTMTGWWTDDQGRFGLSLSVPA